MPTEVVMPQMGESIAEGTITKWLVQPGETVERDQPLFEISTDKVDAEIPSPADGVVIEIKANEGDTIPVNDVVALIGDAGEASDAGGSGDTGEAEEDETDAKAEAKPEAAAASGDEDGNEDTDDEPDEDGEEAEEKAHRDTADDRAASSDDGERDLSTFASPVVKKMAEEHDVDLSAVEGTGSQGRVTKKDLEAYLEGGGEKAATAQAEPPRADKGGPATSAPTAAPKTPTPAPSAPQRPAPSSKPAGGDFWVPAYKEGDDVTIEPMSKIRQITAAHMRYSKDTSAHVTTLFHFDFSKVAAVRRRAKKGFERANNTKLSYMPFVIKAVASALKAHPQVNAALDGTNIVYKNDVNIGIAVALDKGLLVPVIRNADQLSLTGIAKTGNDLADRARTKKLGPDELQGGTFTITNPGVFGSLFGTPIINQPQVAIMGIGAIEKRAVVVSDENGNDALAIRTMAYMPITYDHRLIDGADADHFMNDVKKMIEEDNWGELEPFM
jgi:pyruvate dehydrogenase E2 component (dihydrolipoamide acetyltransferase)